MIHSLHQFNLPLDVQQFMDDTKGCPQEPEIITQLWSKIKPAIFWRDMTVTGRGDGTMQLDGGKLSIQSNYVSKGLAQCHKVTVLAVTIGAALPQQVSEDIASGQLYRASIGDLVGSHSVELLADRFSSYLQERALPQGLFATLRYSPGYGDWLLEVQPQLLTLLDGCKGVITVSDNYLLEPIKTVTAIIGWSHTWQKPQYPQGNHGSGFCNGGHNCAACITWACKKG